MKILVLGLGNELLSDDGIGIAAVKKLKKENLKNVNVIDSNLSGVALIDILAGYKKAIIIDAICTGKFKPGTIKEMTIEDLGTIKSPSPHYTGLPELATMAKQLNIDFPDEIKIFAVEVSDLYTIGGKICKSVSNILNDLINLIRVRLQIWVNEIAIDINI